MANTITTKLTGSLTGQTRTGALTSVPLSTLLQDQDAHVQMTVTVEPSDVNKLVCLPTDQGPTGTQQTLFLIQADLAVQARLNGNTSLTFNLEPGAPLIIGGQPEIDQVEFSGLGASTAAVNITKIIGDATVPVIAIGSGTVAPPPGYALERLADATASQTAFTISQTPGDATKVKFYVDGVMFTSLGASPSITVAGTSITWNDVEFVMAGGEKIHVEY